MAFFGQEVHKGLLNVTPAPPASSVWVKEKLPEEPGIVE